MKIENRNEIIDEWLGEEIVIETLLKKQISINYFREHFAFKVLDYLIDVLEDKAAVGNCPVMVKLLEYFADKNFLPYEVFDICSKFKKTIIKLKFKDKEFNCNDFERINTILDKNLSGVLESYNETLTETYKIQTLAQNQIIRKMAELGEIRSCETHTHVERVCTVSFKIAKEFGLDEEECANVARAAAMHDIGKIGIPDRILNKPGKLTEAEFKVMKTHSIIGYNLLKNTELKMFDESAIVTKHHHEKWDGSGYPDGLKGEDIHIFGRIVGIADVYDALSNKRVYKEAWKKEDIISFFKKERGKHFQPELVDCLLKVIETL